MKHLLRILLRALFGFRAENTGALQTPGPVMLLPNHVSWFDWIFLASCVDTQWRFVTSLETARVSWVHRLLMVNRFTFPVETDSPYAVKRIAEFLQSGGKLVLFPEGRISRTGSLMKLFDGTGFLLFKTRAKVITCYLRGAQRLPLSANPNQKKWFPRVSAHFSDVLTAPKMAEVRTFRARRVLTQWAYDTMVKQQFDVEMAASPKNVLAVIAEAARQWPGRTVLQDASRRQLSYRRLLAAADAMSLQWRDLLRAPESPTPGPQSAAACVGVLLPSTLAAPVALLSLWAAGRTPAIFNFSTGVATMLACARLANVKQVITSRLFIERARLDLRTMKEAGIQFIYLEDVRDRISPWAQFRSLLRVSFNGLHPAPQAAQSSSESNPPSATGNRQSNTAVVLFTSGSEGPPKGVALSHANLIGNARQLLCVIDLMDTDRVFNALPLFHSFGLMGLLLPLARGCYVFLYPSPLHYRVIPSLLYDLDCTVFFGTNTFLNGYARKANPFDFRTVRVLLAAAEKLQESTANLWARQYGVRVLEAYGATECSPGITANTALNPRFGSAGRFLPGIEHKFEPVEGVPEGGRLFVRGPNVMSGYLNADANEKFQALGGWYDTGDIARIDEDGFLHILGRLKRFAKISGEMVSLTAAEEALAGAFPQYGLRFQMAVLARPDADRGEMLIAVANDPRVQLDEVRAAIRAKGLSNLYVPREVQHIRDIPKLGTGKVDHRQLQKLLAEASH
jgi:acyl-[acyl-carrier-protein]-phospholipid O-acyltransferase / long-chain-fatty-acid--[acyl-carrier-protein] ligase